MLFVFVFSAGCGNNGSKDIPDSNSEKKAKMSLKGDPFKGYQETFKKVKNKIKENNQNIEDRDKKTQELFNI